MMNQLTWSVGRRRHLPRATCGREQVSTQHSARRQRVIKTSNRTVQHLSLPSNLLVTAMTFVIFTHGNQRVRDIPIAAAL